MNRNEYSLLLILGTATVCASGCSRTDEKSDLAALERCMNSDSTARVGDSTVKSLTQLARLGADQFVASMTKRWNSDWVPVFEGIEDRGDDILVWYKKDFQGKLIRAHPPNVVVIYTKKTGRMCWGGGD